MYEIGKKEKTDRFEHSLKNIREEFETSVAVGDPYDEIKFKTAVERADFISAMILDTAKKLREKVESRGFVGEDNYGEALGIAMDAIRFMITFKDT